MAIEPLKFGQYYHIYNRGNNGETLFTEPRNYPYFLGLYAKYLLPIAETFAYNLLPNHFHFCIRTYTKEEQADYWRTHPKIGSTPQNEPTSSHPPHSPPQQPLVFTVREPSRAFNNMFIAYARVFNNATDRTGVLFETPFGRKLIDEDPYLRTLILYINQNAQRHGIVKDFRTWSWSSYAACLTKKPTNIQRDKVLEWFGGKERFVDRHLEIADEQSIAKLIEDDL